MPLFGRQNKKQSHGCNREHLRGCFSVHFFYAAVAAVCLRIVYAFFPRPHVLRVSHPRRDDCGHRLQPFPALPPERSRIKRLPSPGVLSARSGTDSISAAAAEIKPEAARALFESAVLARIPALEYPRQILRSDADARIGDAEQPGRFDGYSDRARRRVLYRI